MNKTMKFGVAFCKYVVNKNIDGNANPVKHKKSLIRLYLTWESFSFYNNFELRYNTF